MKRKPGLGRRLGYLLEAMAVVPLGTAVSLLPWSMRGIFSRLLGTAAFHLDRRDRLRALGNLDVVYGPGTLNATQKASIVKRLFVNIARGGFEYFKLGSLTRHNVLRFVEPGNYHVIDQALSQQKGVLVFTAHFGNWEYFGAVGARLGYPIATVIKRQHNPYTDAWLKGLRERKGGVRCIYSEKSVLGPIARHLKKGGILAILADQAYLDRPLWVPFFGLPAPVADGPAKLHFWYESPVVLAFSLRQPDGRYRLLFEGPYGFENSGDLKRDCLRLMTWVYGHYERMIREHPDQWFTLLTPRWR